MPVTATYQTTMSKIIGMASTLKIRATAKYRTISVLITKMMASFFGIQTTTQ